MARIYFKVTPFWPVVIEKNAENERTDDAAETKQAIAPVSNNIRVTRDWELRGHLLTQVYLKMAEVCGVVDRSTFFFRPDFSCRPTKLNQRRQIHAIFFTNFVDLLHCSEKNKNIWFFSRSYCYTVRSAIGLILSSVRLSVTLCIVALRVGVGVESCIPSCSCQGTSYSLVQTLSL